MAIKKPLALYSGKIDELHTSDAITSDIVGYTGTNPDVSIIPKGSPINKKVTASDVQLADATNDTKNCDGFASSDIPGTGGSGIIQTSGTLTLPDWTAIAGSATLTPGSTYYLASVSGTIVTTPPAISGNIVQSLGYAVSTVDFVIEVESRILLA